MLKIAKATIFISLMVGLSWWVAAVIPQQESSEALNQSLVDQDEQNSQDTARLSFPAEHHLDKAETTLNSTTVLSFTPSYTTYLPIVQASSCVPSPPGESNNIADALIVCSGQTVSGQVNDSDWSDVYRIWMKPNQQLTGSMNGTGVGGPGNADLYIFPPDTTDIFSDPAVAVSDTLGNNEFIQGTVFEEGFWFIVVFDCCDGDGGTNYNVTVTVSDSVATGVETFELTENNRLRERGRPKTSD